MQYSQRVSIVILSCLACIVGGPAPQQPCGGQPQDRFVLNIRQKLDKMKTATAVVKLQDSLSKAWGPSSATIVDRLSLSTPSTSLSMLTITFSQSANSIQLAHEELSKFDGHWIPVLCVRSGKKKESSDFISYLKISKGEFTAPLNKEIQGVVTIDPKAKPATIDFKCDKQSGPYSDQIFKGIYQFLGNDIVILNLGVSDLGDYLDRPIDFDPKNSTLLVLERKK